MDDLPIDALDLGRMGCPAKQRAGLVDAFVNLYAGLAHGGRSRFGAQGRSCECLKSIRLGGSSEVLGYAGCAITDLGDVIRGREILRQAVELDPSNAQAQVALGAALALSGDLDGGIACMRHGIKLSPRDRRLAFWGWALGGFLMRANRPAEALEEARLAARRGSAVVLATACRGSRSRRSWADRRRKNLFDFGTAASTRADTARGRDFARSAGDDDFG
jgi:tetratricopeptide (TPR) repeat protein